jgi:phosphoribosylglycinamide formyltransferase-1
LKIAVFSSGKGGNFEHLVSNQSLAKFEVAQLVTDRDCEAEAKAAKLGVGIYRIPTVDGNLDFSQLLQHLSNQNLDLIVLAGFMPIIPARFISLWKGYIINTHPSILPNHGGIGMYGVKVQESVLKSRDDFAGCTVHHVTSDVDMGEIIFQQKFKVPQNITAWELGGIVFRLEGPQLLNAIILLGGEI